MSPSLNKVLLIGRLGKDPQINGATDGRSMASFSLATNAVWTDKDDKRQERTEWHAIVAWDRLAELSKDYLVKGRQIYVEGRIHTREWDDRKGTKRRVTEIIASQILLLDSRSKETSECPPETQETEE